MEKISLEGEIPPESKRSGMASWNFKAYTRFA